MYQNKNMVVLGALLVCLSSCGGEEAPTDQVVVVEPDPLPPPPPSPPPPPPPPPPPTGSSGSVQLDKISSGLDVDEWLKDAAIPDSAAPDVVGAFRFLCAPSHLSYDDPIVHPGDEGAAHLHQFFGNTQADAHSTYESLRKTGDSTCTNMLNRSAYWMPALLDGQGSAIVPNYVAIYYKRRPTTDLWYDHNENQPTVLPRGLKYVFGNPDQTVTFKCVDGWNPVKESQDMSLALAQCAAGQKLMVSIVSPSCWDGKNLDSADHRSHIAHEVRTGSSTKCPASHPYAIATFTMTVEWSIAEGDLPNLWRFSSDMNGVAPGSTFHADWFGAWEDSVMDMWHDSCIDELLNCSDGDLGNGKQMVRNELYPNPSKNAASRKVAIHTVH